MTDECSCQETGEHCCMVHSQEPERIIVDELKPVNTEGGVTSNVSTTFESDILPVLNNIREQLSKLYQVESDKEARMELNEAISCIDRYQESKK